jgi:putative FmdB family regulatory protein
MPLFEYACRACGERFEALVRRADADRSACPKCGSKKTERQLSTFSAAAAAAATACGSGSCGMPGGAGGPHGCSSGACPFSSN